MTHIPVLTHFHRSCSLYHLHSLPITSSIICFSIGVPTLPLPSVIGRESQWKHRGSFCQTMVRVWSNPAYPYRSLLFADDRSFRTRVGVPGFSVGEARSGCVVSRADLTCIPQPFNVGGIYPCVVVWTIPTARVASDSRRTRWRRHLGGFPME